MERILVFSDTHGRTQHCRRAVDNIGKYNMIVHLGDVDRDARFLADNYTACAHAAVRGNNDTFSQLPAQEVLKTEGVRIFLTHGHLFGVKSGLERLKRAAAENSCSVVLFGHTHTPVCREEDGFLLLNPGGFNSFPNPHCGVLELDAGRAYGCLYEIRP